VSYVSRDVGCAGADRRRRVDDGGRGSAGRRGGDAVVVGGGGLDLELEALVALLHLIAGAGADHGVEVVGVVPGIGDGVVALPGARRGRQRLAFLRRAADGGRADRRRRVADAGRGSARRRVAAGRRCRAARRFAYTTLFRSGGLDLELEALVALLHLIAGAGADHGVEVVGVVPGIGDGVVALPGARRGRQRLPFLRRAADG